MVSLRPLPSSTIYRPGFTTTKFHFILLLHLSISPATATPLRRLPPLLISMVKVVAFGGFSRRGTWKDLHMLPATLMKISTTKFECPTRFQEDKSA
ncbi:hypothetical protein SLEP1_g14274 [Rubroshorea leprosula]|uniref:Uncharacterized protein n=1 Tax=Rubroshorea leprosula TaxID=152421 RepID=A0AAV5IPE9_9ROSI|nr:hypothetical protein SLEP1_g14274 [Rubroshorea leprosula]